jgi:UDP-glucose 4-epimerase
VETQKVVVTGGAGFMGSALVDQLVAIGHEVISVDNLLGGFRRNLNKDCKFFKMDLRNFDNVERIAKGADVIFHLAAYAAEGQSIFSPIAINDINITPMNNLLVASVNHGVSRFVFTSSMAVYGNQKPPFSEDMPRKPIDPYGIGKAYCEAMLEAFADAYGFEFVILRPHNVYGPRQNIADSYRNVIGIWMNRIMRGRRPIVYGDGRQTRAFSYIEDITPAIARSGFLPEAANQIMNLGSTRKVSINEACKVLLKTSESSLQPKHESGRPLEVKHAWCTADKSIKLLGYRTKFPLNKGVAKMWAWAKKIGPQEPTYTLPLEIRKKAPGVWLSKTM